MLETLLPIGIIIVLIGIIIFVKKKVNTERDFDERQELIRGKAYKQGFLTVMLCSFAYMLFNMIVEKSYMEDGVSTLVILFIGLTVFSVECIWTGAFFTSTRGNISYLFISLFVFVSEAIGAISSFRDGEMIVDGKLTSDAVMPACALCFLIIFITIILRSYIFREDGED